MHKEILNYLFHALLCVTSKKFKTSLEEALKESMKLTPEEHMERVRKAVEGSLRRSGVLKTKRREDLCKTLQEYEDAYLEYLVRT